MSKSNSKNSDAITKAAFELFKSEGYAHVSVSDICRAANVPRSSFYSIFSGKDEIITHFLRSLKDDQRALLDGFMNAENDLDRIWSLYDKYLSAAVDFGPELTGTLLSLELQKPVGVFDLFGSFNDWFARLVSNCKKQGLIRNNNDAQTIVTLGVRIAVGAAFAWCVSGGAFDLRETAVSELESLYDVPEEYRKAKQN